MNFYELGAGLGVTVQARPRVEVHASPSVRTVAARLSVPGLSIESMQVDLDAVERVKREIDQELNPEPPQTIAKVYVASKGDVAAGVVEDHALLRSAIQAKLDDGSDVAVALLPTSVDTNDNAEDDQESLLGVTRQLLDDVEIPVLESLSAVRQWLTARQARS